MNKVTLDNISLDYPIFDSSSKLLTKQLVSLASAGIIKHKGNVNYVRSLNKINLDLNSGDRLALIGGNGAGKTSILKIISGIYTPSSGTIDVQGKVTSILGTGFGLDEESTGYENIMLGGITMGFSIKETKKMFVDIESFSELGEYLKFPLKTYSAGMRARLAFAITTAVHPEILVIDEGIGAGDQQFFEKAQNRLHGFLDKASILVLASHSSDLLQKLCNKGIVLKKGEVVHTGSIKSCLEHYHSKYLAT